MNNVKVNSPIQQICELILFASKKDKLKKAVLSRSQDKSIKKAVISMKTSSNKSFLQVEYFHTDNKVTHKNIDIDDNSLSILMNISADFSQINLLNHIAISVLITSLILCPTPSMRWNSM